MRNYVNKNQLDIALYANREQLIIKVVFVLASPHYLGHSKPFLIYFRTARNIKYAHSKSHQHRRLGASLVKIVQNVASGTLTSLFLGRRENYYYYYYYYYYRHRHHHRHTFVDSRTNLFLCHYVLYTVLRFMSQNSVPLMELK